MSTLRRTLPAAALLLAAALLGFTGPAAGQVGDLDLPDSGGDPATAPATTAGQESEPIVRFDTALSADGVKPGGRITLAVVLDIKENWHVQVHQPAEDWLIATELELKSLPDGVVYGDTQYPQGVQIPVEFSEKDLKFYEGRAPIFTTLSVGEDVKPGEHTITASVRYQACDDKSCQAPATEEMELTLNVVEPSASVQDANQELFAGYDRRGGGGQGDSLAIPFFGLDFSIDPTKLWLLLPLAALGGLLLNLTPCVLPMIPIKIMGLSKVAADRSRCLLLGSTMSLGVVAFWLGLGAAVALVSGFTAANQLFQYPWFTIAIGGIIAAMAVGMCGLFTVQLPQWVYMINPSHDTVHGSFGFGIMAAVLSTPCTAPFMGAAAAWAATQHPMMTLATFAAIGAGMALPYLLLSAYPALIDRMPRTGPASELIKQVMGVLLLAAAAYFVGTGLSGMLKEPIAPASLAYWWAVGGFIALAGLWLAWRTIRITPFAGKRAIFGGLGVALILVGVALGLRFTDRGPIEWRYYTPEKLEQARAENKAVVMDFTAEWCLNCKALEQAVLHNPKVVQRLNNGSVVPMKVDLTGNNEAGNRKLKEVGRRTIPLLLIYGPNGEVVFKSDAYTVGQVLDALDRAGGARKAETAPADTSAAGTPG